MAKIDRYDGNLQAPASAALGTERTLFGSASQSDDLTDQFNADLLRGWGIVGPSDQPTLQDFNAIAFTLGQIHAYLHQMGIAEYNAAQEYHAGSITNLGGVVYVSITDNNVGNTPSSSPAHWSPFSQGGTVGESRNSRMRTGASPTGTYAADEIIVGTSVGGALRRLSNVSESINLGITGAGGMDVGAPPVTGFVALYVIFNPTTSDVALLATNCTSVSPTETYTKANMPAGYTYSALAAVLRVASSAFSSQVMRGRSVSQDPVLVLNGSTTPRATPFALSIASAVPLNAISCGGSISINGSGAGPGLLIAVGSAVNMEGQHQATLNGSQTSPAISCSFANLLTLPATPQSIHYIASASAGAIVVNITISSYEF